MLAALLGRRDDAERHFADALVLAKRSGSPVWTCRVQRDWALALGDRPDLLAAAHETAAALGMADLAKGGTPVRTAGRASADPLPAGLSMREVEVLRLAAAGRSNREISEQLFISPNTVANHVRAILLKTSSANRAEATAFAARHGLLP